MRILNILYGSSIIKYLNKLVKTIKAPVDLVQCMSEY
jgi:hypothetical protein